MHSLVVKLYLFSPTSKCIVSYTFPCWTTTCRLLPRTRNPHQLPHDVINRTKRVVDHVVAAPFNMGNCNWLQTLRSHIINMERWLMYTPPPKGKKYHLYIDHWMNPVGAHIAEIAAKMIATRRSRSNSSVVWFFNVRKLKNLDPIKVWIYLIYRCQICLIFGVSIAGYVGHYVLQHQDSMSDISGKDWRCPTGRRVFANTVYTRLEVDSCKTFSSYHT